MRSRPLGNTGLTVSELALGTWGLCGEGYGPVSDDEADRVVDRALSLGISLFETADSYGHGAMERRLGARLAASYGPTWVVTKIGTDRAPEPPRKRFDPAYLRQAALASRERLQRERIDVLLLHNPTVLGLRLGGATDAMKSLVAEGVCTSWGVSAGSDEVAREAIARGAAVLELVYNAFLPGDLHRLASEVSGANVGVLCRSVLAHGLLTGHWGQDRTFDEGDHRAERWSVAELRHRLSQLAALRPLVSGGVSTLRSAALRFVLSNDLVGSAVLGPRNVPQLEQLVREAGAGPPYFDPVALTDASRRLEAAGIDMGHTDPYGDHPAPSGSSARPQDRAELDPSRRDR